MPGARLSKVFLLVMGVVACSRTQTQVAKTPDFDNSKPDITIDAFGGRLLGFDRGEWGGRLAFEEKGKARTVLQENVKAIIPTDRGVFVFTGLSHLGTEEGYIYWLSSMPPGDAVTPFLLRGLYKLDGEPRSIELVEPSQAGEFKVNTGKLNELAVPHEPIYQCLVLEQNLELKRTGCPYAIPVI